MIICAQSSNKVTKKRPEAFSSVKTSHFILLIYSMSLERVG